MKLRRALTAAAATAVMAPAALMAAPAAFATGADTETSASADPAPATPGPEQSDDTTTPAETPGAGDETPADGTTQPGDDTKPGEETGNGGQTGNGDEAEPTAPATPGDDTKPTSTPEPSTSATPTAKPTEEPTDEPTCAEQSDEMAISTELRGLPSKVVAGSGWKNFTFRATNTSDKAMKSVDAYVALAGISSGNFDDISKLLTVQWYDEDTRTWESITDEDGYFASVDALKPDEYADAKLRLKVDAKTPGSYGFAFTIGAYHNEDDVCGFSDVAEYDFDILVAGSHPGSVPPAKSKPGKSKGNKPAPTGDLKQIPVTGKLAETGSSSALPTIALVGGVAMALGAGAIFVVRRRKTAGVNGAAAA